MKKYILLTVITLLSISIISAQNKPTKGTSGIGINYRLSQNVNFPVLKYDYYLTNSWVLNATFKPNFLHSTSNSSNESSSNKSKDSRYGQSIGIGIEKHFFDNLKIDPFVGLSLYHGLNTRTISERIREGKDDLGYTYYNKEITKYPMTNSISPALNLGLNYFILNNFSVGMQLNTGYSFVFVNGNQTEYVLESATDPVGNILRFNENTRNTKVKSTSGSLFYQIALKTAFYFPVKNKQK